MMITTPRIVIGRRHSISGHCQQLNSGGGSPDFSTPNAVEKPLSSTFEQMAGSMESLNRSASSKQRSKALSFGDLSKRVFDLSCSNASPAAIQKSSENAGQQNHHGAESKGVSDLDATQETRSHVPATPTRECGILELPEDDNSKMPENGRCLGMSPSHYLLQCTSPSNSSNWFKNEDFFNVLESFIQFHVGLARSCPTLCFFSKVFMYHKQQNV